MSHGCSGQCQHQGTFGVDQMSYRPNVLWIFWTGPTSRTFWRGPDVLGSKYLMDALERTSYQGTFGVDQMTYGPNISWIFWTGPISRTFWRGPDVLGSNYLMDALERTSYQGPFGMGQISWWTFWTGPNVLQGFAHIHTWCYSPSFPLCIPEKCLDRGLNPELLQGVTSSSTPR